jgi:alpha-tubulin suppressor-like RCC1 family protein
VVAVAAANDFSVALDETGQFYTWGAGLLNLPEWEAQTIIPTASKVVEQLLSKRHAKIKKIAAIDSFILLLLDNGRIYGYGKNKAGVFGARTNPLVLSDIELASFARIYDALFKNEKIVDF